MLPDPLHPAVVHFPVVLAFLLPFFALGAIWMIRRGSSPRHAWAIPLAMAAALWLSAWAAVETGEGQDERVERVVSEQPLSTHEDMAEMFLTASIVVMLVTAGGMAPGRVGKAGRALAAAGSIVLVIGAARVGHSGGQLVYRYGAASAYASGPSSDSTKSPARAGERAEDSDDR
jgi:hypothetical protein